MAALAIAAQSPADKPHPHSLRLVRDFLATVTEEDLLVERANPWSPDYPESTLSCVRTILEEEWEHHRYAVRDLDAIERGGSPD